MTTGSYLNIHFCSFFEPDSPYLTYGRGLNTGTTLKAVLFSLFNFDSFLEVFVPNGV